MSLTTASRDDARGGPLTRTDLARLIDLALERADAEAPLMDALDDAVDALGPDAVREHLLALVATVPTLSASAAGRLVARVGP